jgi:hypothetical protein
MKKLRIYLDTSVVNFLAEVNQATGYPELLRLLSPLEVEDENGRSGSGRTPSTRKPNIFPRAKRCATSMSRRARLSGG